MEFSSVKEMSDKWGITERQVRNRCNNKKIVGAQKIGKSWVIPSNAERPSKTEQSLNDKFSKNREIQRLKHNYVIVHGTFGHPGENWFPWLAEQISILDKSGFTQKEDILIPHFPSSACADYDSWKSVLMGYIDSGIINKKTIFICHSLGPLFVSRVLIEEKIKVKGMICVEAAANHLMGNESFDKINKTFFVPSWDYLNKVKKYLDFNYCFYTDNDPHIPFNILKEYIKHAATKSFFIPGAGHFNAMSGYTTFPQLLELLKDIEKDKQIEEDKIEKFETKGLWTKHLSHKWTNMTWPNRPSVSELAIYTKCLRNMKNYKKDVLVLGSNVEYRDWAYEENLNISLMNNNEEYHLATYRELRHKNAPYRLILRDWRSVDFENAFDLIVGDELIGNLGTDKIESFICRVAKSLKKEGYFFSKSFYIPKDYKVKSPKEIFEDYYKNGGGTNPIAYCIFDLTLYCLDKDNFVDFEKINYIINDLFKKKIITEETFNILSDIGLDEMNYKFWVPSIEDYEKIISKYFVIENKLFTDDVGAENFPIYILKKR